MVNITSGRKRFRHPLFGRHPLLRNGQIAVSAGRVKMSSHLMFIADDTLIGEDETYHKEKQKVTLMHTDIASSSSISVITHIH